MTENASRAITITVDAILQCILDAVSSDDAKVRGPDKIEKTLKLSDFTEHGWGFKEYWSSCSSSNSGHYGDYLLFTSRIIESVCKKNEGWRSILTTAQNSGTWVGVITSNTGQLTKVGVQYFSEKPRERDVMLKKLGFIVQWACMTSESCNRLQLLLSGDTSKHAQRSQLSPATLAYFRTFEFLDGVCLGPIRDIYRMVHNKAYYEAHLMQELSMIKPAIYATELENWLGDPNVDYQAKLNEKEASGKPYNFANNKEGLTPGELFNAGSLNIVPARDGLDLVDVSVVQYVFNGFVEAVVKYGMNPVIKIDNDKSRFLRMYLE